ncbi:MAG TPA: hypothetical protein VFQ61_26015 [Polyangiaceae bacterium]|nr:hypothetical protein [Polyangiaceae bacterium]
MWERQSLGHRIAAVALALAGVSTMVAAAAPAPSSSAVSLEPSASPRALGTTTAGSPAQSPPAGATSTTQVQSAEERLTRALHELLRDSTGAPVEQSAYSRPSSVKEVVDAYLRSTKGLGGASRPRLLPLVVSLPDPTHASISMYYDQGLAALRAAVLALGFRQGRFVLPARVERLRGGAKDASEPASVNHAEDHAPDSPGVMLFHDEDGNLIVALLVLESAVLGARLPELELALQAAWEIAQVGARSTPPPAVPVVAPFFSGTAQSLLQALSRVERAPERFTVFTGTATNPALEAWFARSLPNLRFQRTVPSHRELQHFALEVIERAEGPSLVACFSELGTGLTASSSLPNQEDEGRRCNAELPFPVHISELRSEQARANGGPPSLFAGLRRTIQLKMDGPEARAGDALSALSPFTIVDDDVTLGQELQRICEQRYKYLIVHATDPSDVVFLAQQSHKYCPDISIVTLGYDQLFVHPNASATMAGALVISSHAPTHEFVNHARSFPNSVSQGFFHAVKSAAHTAWSLGAVDIPPGNSLDPTSKPRLFASQIHNARFWPIDSRALPPRVAPQRLTPTVSAARPDPAERESPWPTSVRAQFIAWPILLLALCHFLVRAAQARARWRRLEPHWLSALKKSVRVPLQHLRRVSPLLDLFLRDLSDDENHTPRLRSDLSALFRRASSSWRLPQRSRLLIADLGLLLLVVLAVLPFLSASIVEFRSESRGAPPVWSWRMLPQRSDGPGLLVYIGLIDALGTLGLIAFDLVALFVGLYNHFQRQLQARRAFEARSAAPSPNTIVMSGDDPNPPSRHSDYDTHVRFSRWPTFVATALVTVTAGWLVYQVTHWCLQPLWASAPEAVDREAYRVLRLLDPFGMSPAAPLLLLGTGIYVWSLYALCRIERLDRFPDEAPDASPSATYTALGCVWNELRFPWSHARYHLPLMLVVGILSWKFFTHTRSTFEHADYVAAFKLGFVLLGALVAAELVRFLTLSGLLLEALRRLASEPMTDAYGRISANISGSFGLQLRARVPLSYEFATCALACRTLERLQTQLQPTFGSHFDALKTACRDVESALLPPKPPPFDVQYALARTERNAHGKLFTAAARMHSVLIDLWRVRAASPELDILKLPRSELRPGGAHASEPTCVLLRGAMKRDVLLWMRAAEEFVALRSATFIYQVLHELRHTLTFALLGATALVFSVTCYPFQPGRLLTVCSWAIVILAAACGFARMVSLEKSEVLSRIGGTKPAALELNRTFVSQLLLYVALPIGGAVVGLFPGLAEVMAVQLSSLVQLLPAGK